jgi:hypothetical protein
MLAAFCADKIGQHVTGTFTVSGRKITGRVHCEAEDVRGRHRHHDDDNWDDDDHHGDDDSHRRRRGGDDD